MYADSRNPVNTKMSQHERFFSIQRG